MPDQSIIESLKSRVKAFGDQFYIQLGHVKTRNADGQSVKCFQEVFPIIFSEDDEAAYLFWKQIPIRFHYTYECYANIDALILWFEKMKDHRNGEHKCTLLTDVFIIELSATWDAKNIKIESNWMVKTNHQKLADALNEKGPLVATVDRFLGEWKPFLVQLVRGIDASGIAFDDPQEKDKIRRIKALTPYISDTSKLYAKDGV
ncbi:MAG: hypothetical protein COA38_02885 [Fluviicola sp.]|nr:MAG: hypothetical protein COA38_02885 [Fluviicola sp.]